MILTLKYLYIFIRFINIKVLINFYETLLLSHLILFSLTFTNSSHTLPNLKNAFIFLQALKGTACVQHISSIRSFRVMSFPLRYFPHWYSPHSSSDYLSQCHTLCYTTSLPSLSLFLSLLPWFRCFCCERRHTPIKQFASRIKTKDNKYNT